MKLEKKISWKRYFNVFSFDDLLIDFIKKQDLPDKDKEMMVRVFPKIMDFILGVGRFILFFWIFTKAYNKLGEQFYVLVFTFLVVFMFKKSKKV